jgi:hypothetical protein
MQNAQDAFLGYRVVRENVDIVFPIAKDRKVNA